MDIKDLILSKETLSVIDNGAWVEVETEFGPIEFFTCGFQSEHVQKYIASEKEKIKIETGEEPSEELVREIVQEAMIELMVKDWRGIEDDGKPVEYTKDLLRSILDAKRSPAAVAFFVSLFEATKKIDTNARQYVEKTSKNCAPASAGKSKTRKQEK